MDSFCNFCGSRENELYRYNTVPERWGLYVFCKSGNCALKYDRYVYVQDLTYGLPYADRQNASAAVHDKDLYCLFCGEHDDLCQLPWNREDIFCHNSRCYKQYTAFSRFGDNDEDVFVTQLPYVNKMRLVEKYKNSLSEYLFSVSNK